MKILKLPKSLEISFRSVIRYFNRRFRRLAILTVWEKSKCLIFSAYKFDFIYKNSFNFNFKYLESVTAI